VFAHAGAMLWFLAALGILYLVDVAFAAIGYISTSQRLGAEIRSSNPYLLGWTAALICYPPFFVWLGNIGFAYKDGYEWFHWLGATGWLAWAWGGAILVLVGIYA